MATSDGMVAMSPFVTIATLLKFLLMTPRCSPGSSAAPILDEYGKVMVGSARGVQASDGDPDQE
jgi:hypothetical protein